MTRSALNSVRTVAVILAITAGTIALIPCQGWTAESSAMEHFHFFDTPPDANDLSVVTTDDRPLKLSDLRGKVVLLNFWRRDCPYCEQEKHYFKDMESALNSNEFVVLCVDFWDRPAWVTSYAQQHAGAITFAYRPPGHEAVMENVVKGRVMGYFVLNEAKEAIYEVKGFPSTYVVDREGKVLAAHLGMARWADPQVVKWLKSLETPTPAPFTPADAYYELPSWLNRLLSGASTDMENTHQQNSLRSTP